MDWSKVLEQVVLALVGLLMPFVAAWLVAKIKIMWADARAWSPDVMSIVEQVAVAAVRAAEQAGVARIVTDKKAYALKIAEDWLALKGVKVDLHLIDAAIEAAVFSEFNKYKWPPEPTPAPVDPPAE